MAVARSHPGVAAISEVEGTLIYVVGGYDGKSALDTVELLDVRASEWGSASPMLVARYACAAVVVEGALFVVGGRSGEDVLSSVERLDPVRLRLVAGGRDCGGARWC